MKTLRKPLLIATVVTGLGLGAVALAGPWGGHGPMGDGMGDCPMMGGGRGMGRGPMGGGPESRMERMQQFHAERMELLEARLKLKPGQQDAWKAFLTAQDVHHAERMKIRQERRNSKETTAMAHFEGRLQVMEQNLASMKTMVKAAGDFYATLDPEQKQVMDQFFTDRRMRRMMRGADVTPDQPDQPDE